MNEEQRERFLAAVFPTKPEAAVRATALFCYEIAKVSENDPPETTYGPFGWIGDHLCELETAMQRRRVKRARHMAGRR